MNPEERELMAGLRALASDGPRQASVELETRLIAEFRQQSRLRRTRAWISAASGGAIAAAIAILVWIGPVVSNPGAAPPDQAVLADEAVADFYPLPDADALPPVESAMVVRVQLPMASLESIGFPIDTDRAADPVEADVLLGQDGLARGVRLVE